MPRDHADELERMAWQAERPALEVLEMFLERAAIREYEGNMPRGYAEREAVRDVAEILGLNDSVQASQHARPL